MNKSRIVLSFLLIVVLFFTIGNTNTAYGEGSSITYKGELPSQQVHSYSFSTAKEGTLSIRFLSNTEVFYSLVDKDTEKPYYSGDSLPVGDYVLSISSTNKSDRSYEIKLTGDLDLSGDTELPSLNVSEPSPFTKLSVGDFNTGFNGSSNGSTINYIINRHTQANTLSSSFSKSVDVLFGTNTIVSFAESANDNSITDTRTVVSPGAKRISGDTLYLTYVEISKEIDKFGGNTDTVIITDAWDGFNDSILGVVLGYQEKAPLLSIDTDFVPDEILGEIKRLGAKKAIIIGGTVVVSDEAEAQLRDAGLSVERISGDTRTITSNLVAEKIMDEYSTSAIIVNGLSFDEPLLISSYAAETGKPILYTNGNYLLEDTVKFLTDNPQLNDFILVGNTEVASTNVEKELEEFGKVRRVSSSDIYELPNSIASDLHYTKRSAVVAATYYDGIPGALLGAFSGANLYLTPEDEDLHGVVKDTFNDKLQHQALDNVYLIGGTLRVPQSVEDYLHNLFK
ncbi:cell wall-binding repeat-containing protein [Bacillus spongiae]|uniref:Cell wall-binding repeat-containing protein n=1 Tax=Bacillus spongiae TaxID=2683610 RepID=A0ABU8HHA9_9BACI